jgi:hypothetical protein
MACKGSGVQIPSAPPTREVQVSITARPFPHHPLSRRRMSPDPWYWAFQPETSRSICQVLARELISIGRQPMLIAATRCYLIQMLRLTLTCANGCSCWSPGEENSPRIFLTMDVLCRLS